MRRKRVEFVLKETIEDMGISGNRVAITANIRSNTIYEMLSNTKKTISLEQLTSLINALNLIAKEEGIKKKYDITDVIR